MSEKREWIIIDRGGKIFHLRMSNGETYHKVLEALGSEIRDRGFDEGLPNTLILNGKIIIASDLWQVASDYRDAFEKAWVTAKEQTNVAFSMPTPKVIT